MTSDQSRPTQSHRCAPISEVDDNAIRDLVSRAQESQSDPENLIPLHSPAVVIVNLAGRRVLGRETYAAAMVDALATPLRDVRTTVEIVDIRLAAPDVAIVSCTKTVHDGRSAIDAATVLPSTAALTYVTTRKDDRWRIAVAQTTPILVATTG